MEVVVVIIVVVAGVVAFSKYQARANLQLAATREGGRLQHLRTGDYPASCSWCKNTALARRLLVFERENGGWKAADVMYKLQSCPVVEVQAVSSVLVADQAQWRRFCTEKCVKEFFVAEHITTVEAFSSCDYCSCRSPVALMQCPNCGARRR